MEGGTETSGSKHKALIVRQVTRRVEEVASTCLKDLGETQLQTRVCTARGEGYHKEEAALQEKGNRRR